MLPSLSIRSLNGQIQSDQSFTCSWHTCNETYTLAMICLTDLNNVVNLIGCDR